MHKGRLEAFSDGVIAIIITIMVLEMKVPKGHDLASLQPLIPVFLSYVLSFVFIGIYWNNHHHMLQATQKVGGGILWANLHLLFWLSLVPFVTGWMGESHFDVWPVACYGIVLLGAAIAYTILEHLLTKLHGEVSVLAKARGNSIKEWISLTFYAAAIPIAFVNRWISCAVFVTVAIIWLIPDRRIAAAMDESSN